MASDSSLCSNDLAKQLGFGSRDIRLAGETAMLGKLKVSQSCTTPWVLFCDGDNVKFVLDSAFSKANVKGVQLQPQD